MEQSKYYAIAETLEISTLSALLFTVRQQCRLFRVLTVILNISLITEISTLSAFASIAETARSIARSVAFSFSDKLHEKM